MLFCLKQSRSSCGTCSTAAWLSSILLKNPVSTGIKCTSKLQNTSQDLMNHQLVQLIICVSLWCASTMTKQLLREAQLPFGWLSVRGLLKRDVLASDRMQKDGLEKAAWLFSLPCSCLLWWPASNACLFFLQPSGLCSPDVIQCSSFILFFRFDGRVVAKLPFIPLSYIQGLSHRNLLGEDYTDCSFIFLYILCTMSIRQVSTSLSLACVEQGTHTQCSLSIITPEH